jgi:ankyrin repeat protein
MLQLLLERGATVNSFDKKDRRALHWAAYMGHVDIVRILLKHEAEINCRDKQVNIVLFYLTLRTRRSIL